MSQEKDSRIIALEETVAHQGRMLEELSNELTEQWKATELMRKKLDRLTELFLELGDRTPEAPANTRPPHY